MLDYGNVTILGTGEGFETLRTIARPLAVFAGIWCSWTGARGMKANPVEGDHTLFGFPTCDANDVVGAVHPKAMPVVLTTEAEIEQWMSAAAEEALNGATATVPTKPAPLPAAMRRLHRQGVYQIDPFALSTRQALDALSGRWCRCRTSGTRLRKRGARLIEKRKSRVHTSPHGIARVASDSNGCVAAAQIERRSTAEPAASRAAQFSQ
jgi:hypothetical protein